MLDFNDIFTTIFFFFLLSICCFKVVIFWFPSEDILSPHAPESFFYPSPAVKHLPWPMNSWCSCPSPRAGLRMGMWPTKLQTQWGFAWEYVGLCVYLGLFSVKLRGWEIYANAAILVSHEVWNWSQLTWNQSWERKTKTS